jgi:SAM-dependent methyltransferase
MTADNPVTGRRFLTESAYADDRHLRSRMGIWAYAEAAPDPGWRISAVPWDGTQVVADVGCGNGFDLRQLVPGGRCRHAVGIDLSAGMLRGLAELSRSGGLSLVQADAQQLPLGDGSVDVVLAMHMLYHLPDVGAAVADLRRITRPGGTVLASTNSPSSMAEVHELLDAAASGLLGRPVRALPPLSFTTETGAAVLAGQFSEVTLRRHEIALSFPAAGPVVAYLSSIREPVLAYSGGQFPFDEALAELAVRVEQAIRAQGSFRATSRSGVFICR